MGIKIKYEDGSTVSLQDGCRDLPSIEIGKSVGGIYHISEPCDIEIYNLSGLKVRKEHNVDCFDIDNFSPGLYLIKLEAIEGNARKVLKIRHN